MFVPFVFIHTLLLFIMSITSKISFSLRKSDCKRIFFSHKMCGGLFFQFLCFCVCFPFHLNLPRFDSTQATSFLWLWFLKRVFWVGNYILLGIV